MRYGTGLSASGGLSGGDDLHRLPSAHQAARLLGERDTREVVQAWFHSLKPCAGRPVARTVLREGGFDEVGAQVLAAVRHVAAVG